MLVLSRINQNSIDLDFLFRVSSAGIHVPSAEFSQGLFQAHPGC